MLVICLFKPYDDLCMTALFFLLDIMALMIHGIHLFRSLVIFEPPYYNQTDMQIKVLPKLNILLIKQFIYAQDAVQF
jgi:hypothetical protein